MDGDSLPPVIRVSTLGYWQWIRLTVWSLTECLSRGSSRSLADQVRDFVQIRALDVLLVSFTAFLFLWLRNAFQKRSQKWAVDLQVSEKFKRENKLSEYLWKIGCNLFNWLISAAILFLGSNSWFSDPLSVYDFWTPKIEMPTSVYFLYVVQMGWYVQSVYAFLSWEPVRKDHKVMLFHHFVAISLVVFSFIFRYFVEGVLTLFCHDLCDVFLNSWKLNHELRTRAGGRFERFHGRLSDLSVTLFISSWAFFRLYLFPLKVLYLTTYGPIAMGAERPLYLFLNLFMFFLHLMNLYWFALMINGILQLLRGDMKVAKDIREDD